MVPPVSSGSDHGGYELSDLSVTPDRIAGRFRLNGLNRPTVTIDRRSGRIVLDGLTKFRGACDLVGDGDRRRF
ncbi:hypothetical protein [Phenylobacterium sp. J367]|uniref:hypothetical protein n=1 Tax=Phenylobacterium sp. J367 TaxID=2898435 RepID=UPI0021510DE2|nr:hypothetical protein [Phenylobacterium sp. J367]MCR5879415.1 hypothetical protein [Phenylobacterium sp. J367]